MGKARGWRFRPLENAEAAFESAYGPEGDWARLFRTATGFLCTTLLKGEGTPAEGRASEFAALDPRCESLTGL